MKLTLLVIVSQAIPSYGVSSCPKGKDHLGKNQEEYHFEGQLVSWHVNNCGPSPFNALGLPWEMAGCNYRTRVSLTGDYFNVTVCGNCSAKMAQGCQEQHSWTEENLWLSERLEESTNATEMLLIGCYYPKNGTLIYGNLMACRNNTSTMLDPGYYSIGVLEECIFMNRFSLKRNSKNRQNQTDVLAFLVIGWVVLCALVGWWIAFSNM